MGQHAAAIRLLFQVLAIDREGRLPVASQVAYPRPASAHIVVVRITNEGSISDNGHSDESGQSLLHLVLPI